MSDERYEIGTILVHTSGRLSLFLVLETADVRGPNGLIVIHEEGIEQEWSYARSPDAWQRAGWRKL